MTIIHGLDNAAYRANPALSYSESKLVARSPAHLRHWLDHPRERRTPGPGMAFGTMTHTALLEPATFDQRYGVVPDISKNSREYKTAVIELAAQGLQPCTQEDREAAFACAHNVRTHPTSGPLFATGFAEVSCFWTDPRTGLECKARIDWIHPVGKGVQLVDFKTAQDASRDAFRRTVTNLGYHFQADWYEGGYSLAANVPVSPMLFVVVESDPPYAVACYTLDRWFMAQAAKRNHTIRGIWKNCLDMNDFPGYDPAITDLDAPRYALDEDLRELQREETYA
jgi:exodeoxyribonuclease VIII